MDKIRKFVKRLNKKWAKRIEKALQDVMTLHLEEYEVEKMEGLKNLYRIRIGNVRIIFQKMKNHGIPIDIDFRGKIYKKYR